MSAFATILIVTSVIFVVVMTAVIVFLIKLRRQKTSGTGAATRAPYGRDFGHRADAPQDGHHC